MDGASDITEILLDAAQGDGRAADVMMPLVYDQLRAMAADCMRRERPDHTLQPTALVHEAYLKLVDQTRVAWRDRAHFFAVAAMAIRRILLDHARSKRCDKHGGGRRRECLIQDPISPAEDPLDFFALDEGLNELSHAHPELSRIVEMRFFAGMTLEEIGTVLDMSGRTVQRKWQYARAVLYRLMQEGKEEGPYHAS